MFELAGKVALITGAAKRLGAAITLGLAEQGTNVIIHYNKSKIEAQKLKTQTAKHNVKSWLLGADLGKPESCRKLIEKAYEHSRRLDILINNASIFMPTSINDAEPENLLKELIINAWAPFLLSKTFAEKTKDGKIINILDTRIAGYDFNHFPYYLSKRMLATLTESLALKLAPNVTVNAIAPGLILPPEDKGYDYLEQKKHTVPLKKYGSPDNIATTVIFLLKNDFVTGQTIYVDGGKHLLQTIEGL